MRKNGCGLLIFSAAIFICNTCNTDNINTIEKKTLVYWEVSKQYNHIFGKKEYKEAKWHLVWISVVQSCAALVQLEIIASVLYKYTGNPVYTSVSQMLYVIMTGMETTAVALRFHTYTVIWPPYIYRLCLCAPTTGGLRWNEVIHAYYVWRTRVKNQTIWWR